MADYESVKVKGIGNDAPVFGARFSLTCNPPLPTPEIPSELSELIWQVAECLAEGGFSSAAIQFDDLAKMRQRD